jgi:hypothetical protein
MQRLKFKSDRATQEDREDLTAANALHGGLEFIALLTG